MMSAFVSVLSVVSALTAGAVGNTVYSIIRWRQREKTREQAAPGARDIPDDEATTTNPEPLVQYSDGGRTVAIFDPDIALQWLQLEPKESEPSKTITPVDKPSPEPLEG